MLMDQKPQKSLNYRGAILLGTESAPLSEDEDEKVKFLLGFFPRPSDCQQNGTMHMSGPLWNEMGSWFQASFYHISASYLAFMRSTYF